MARHETVLTAFAASPGDVAEERALLEDVIRELNITWSRNLGLRIDLIRLETHSYHIASLYPQSAINEQFGDDYDIFVGMMWIRYGNPTLSNESGTEEVFEKAYARHKAFPNAVKIMFYFKDAGPHQLSKIDA